MRGICHQTSFSSVWWGGGEGVSRALCRCVNWAGELGSTATSFGPWLMCFLPQKLFFFLALLSTPSLSLPSMELGMFSQFPTILGCCVWWRGAGGAGRTAVPWTLSGSLLRVNRGCSSLGPVLWIKEAMTSLHLASTECLL